MRWKRNRFTDASENELKPPEHAKQRDGSDLRLSARDRVGLYYSRRSRLSSSTVKGKKKKRNAFWRDFHGNRMIEALAFRREKLQLSGKLIHAHLVHS